MRAQQGAGGAPGLLEGRRAGRGRQGKRATRAAGAGAAAGGDLGFRMGTPAACAMRCRSSNSSGDISCWLVIEVSDAFDRQHNPSAPAELCAALLSEQYYGQGLQGFH